MGHRLIPLAGTVLVVDDDQDMCWVFETALAAIGQTATTVGLALDAISLLTEMVFPITFVDARLPDMDGLRLIEKMRDLWPDMKVVLISGYFLEDDAFVLEAMRTRKIDGFLAKPFRIEAIAAAASSAAPPTVTNAKRRDSVPRTSGGSTRVRPLSQFRTNGA